MEVEAGRSIWVYNATTNVSRARGPGCPTSAWVYKGLKQAYTGSGLIIFRSGLARPATAGTYNTQDSREFSNQRLCPLPAYLEKRDYRQF